jgi:hypothetical protein
VGSRRVAPDADVVAQSADCVKFGAAGFHIMVGRYNGWLMTDG